ncbi:hypothetical protein K7432_005682 [Basidiobolus ranarum]|uniref:C3H1-type domain-containing protein n=1 Tax=Basidiobolus ranarum TaxID=34480 RepID=A0ABR2WW48_9FUNG
MIITALWKAANEGDITSLRFELLNTPEHLDTPDALGRTPLMIASKGNHVQAVRELLLAGADPDVKNELGTATEFTTNGKIVKMITDVREGLVPEMPTPGSATFKEAGFDVSDDRRSSTNSLDCPFLRRGSCPNGKRCSFSHPKEEDIVDSEEEEGVAEQQQRMRNCGFTDDEVQVLLSQGVRPTDENAWDVLASLAKCDRYREGISYDVLKKIHHIVYENSSARDFNRLSTGYEHGEIIHEDDEDTSSIEELEDLINNYHLSDGAATPEITSGKVKPYTTIWTVTNESVQ